MTTKELKQIIGKQYGWDRFKAKINSEGQEPEWKVYNYRDHKHDEKYPLDETFESLTGLSFKYLEDERGNTDDHDQYYWRFKIGDKFYEVGGYYNSNDGAKMDKIEEFYEVRAEEVTITVWNPVE